MSDTSGATSAKAVSFAAPFRHAAFTVIWTATLVSNVGGWMYSAASGWLMTSLNPDPLIAALVEAEDEHASHLHVGVPRDFFATQQHRIVPELLYAILWRCTCCDGVASA